MKKPWNLLERPMSRRALFAGAVSLFRIRFRRALGPR